MLHTRDKGFLLSGKFVRFDYLSDLKMKHFPIVRRASPFVGLSKIEGGFIVEDVLSGDDRYLGGLLNWRGRKYFEQLRSTDLAYPVYTHTH